ncbi:uncharacterized protein LOC121424324 isoform X2 [Lytechinus variegatus]|uniref:uncharacterized protein LOC121424324 isoform X2 n=1 Tax=Lytechinus variegatus TaxID=7654 RepID=UPI001BB123DF|nr:uncharacterized protein LOC121424324 isoform X2 [Lytechinus variegatus]
MDCFHVAFIISVVTSVSYSYGLKVITASLGERATLPCELQDSATDNILSLYWRKDGTTVYSQTTNGEVGHDRYSVIDASSLVIPDVTKSDAGNYSCKIVSQTFQTEESDITQLYVTDVAVSHCQDNGDGECSCFINGSNITSLKCSASGFQLPPVITWDVGQVTYRSSTLDLTKFAENFTLVCKAKDRSVDNMDNKTVCVYYMPESSSTMSTEISPVVTSSTSSDRVFLALMILFIILLIVSCVGLLYMNHTRTKGSRNFHLPIHLISRSTSTPKSQQTSIPLEATVSYDAGDVNVVKDSWKYAKGSDKGSVNSNDGPRSVYSDDIDYSPTCPKDCNEDMVLVDEAAPSPALPLVGQVLLDDLRSATEETEEAMKNVIVALLSKRKEPYEDDQSHIEPSISVQSTFMPTPLQNSLKLDPGLAFVHMVLDDLDQILDARDRDECEILITKPGLRDITDESQIPTYQGNRVIQQSRLGNSYQSPTQDSMTSSMVSSMMAYTNTPLASVLENELRKKPTERTAMRNSISQIILDGMTAGYSKRGNQERLISRSTGGLPSLGADSGIHSSKEGDDIPPTAKLLDSNG